MSKSFWMNRAEQALQKLEEYERYGDDDFEEGAVILFEYQFVSGGVVYSYAALKVNGLWYTTGPRSPKAYTWDQLVSWFAEARNEVHIWLVDSATLIV